MKKTNFPKTVLMLAISSVLSTYSIIGTATDGQVNGVDVTYVYDAGTLDITIPSTGSANTTLTASSVIYYSNGSFLTATGTTNTMTSVDVTANIGALTGKFNLSIAALYNVGSNANGYNLEWGDLSITATGIGAINHLYGVNAMALGQSGQVGSASVSLGKLTIDVSDFSATGGIVAIYDGSSDEYGQDTGGTGAGSISTDGIFMTIKGGYDNARSTVSSSIFGVSMAYGYSPTVTIGYENSAEGSSTIGSSVLSVKVTDVDPTVTNKYYISPFQPNATGDTAGTPNIKIYGDINLEVANSGEYDGNYWAGIRGITSINEGTTDIKGSVTLSLDTVSSNQIEAVAAIRGNVTVGIKDTTENTNVIILNMYDMDEPDNGDTYEVSALSVGLSNGQNTDYAPIVNVYGNILTNMIEVSGDSFEQDIFGVAMTTNNQKDESVYVAGDVVTNIGWTSGNASMANQSIYGAVNGSDGSIQITGKRYLNLGTGSVQFYSGSYTGYFITSDTSDSSVPSFSNFDVLTVNSGSNLYLTPANQTSHLIAESAVFSDIGDGNPAENSDRISGIASYAGRLYLSAESDGYSASNGIIGKTTDDTYSELVPESALYLNTSSDADNYITQLQNNGKVRLASGVKLTLTDANMVVYGQDTTDTKVAQSYNTGSISGNGTLNFEASETYNITGYVYDADGNVTDTYTDVTAKSETFYNYANGTITVTNINFNGADVSNASNALIAGVKVTQSGGSVENSGLFAAYSLEQTGGSINNSDTTIAVTLTQKTGGTSTPVITSSDILAASTLEQDSGTIDITAGSFVVPEKLTVNINTDNTTINQLISAYNGQSYTGKGATLTSGNVSVQNGASGEVWLNASSSVGSKVYVTGKLGLGTSTLTLTETGLNPSASTLTETSGILQTMGWVENDADFQQQNNILGVNQQVRLSSTGYIGVASAMSQIATTALAAPNTTETGLYFGADSVLVIANDVAGQDSSNAAFITDEANNLAVSADSSSAKILVETQYNEAHPYKYYITSGFSYDGQELWSNDNAIVVDEYGNKYDQYEVRTETVDGVDNVYLYYDSDEPVEPTEGPCELGYAACHNIQADEDNEDNPDPGTQAVLDIVGDQNLPESDRVRIMNSIANLPFAGGVMGVGLNGLTSAITDIFNHLTMDSDTFGAHGVMWPYQEFSNMWLDVHGTWYNQKHLSATKIDRAGWRASAFGFILGYDRKLKERPVAIGGAFSFTGGNVKSTGNISYTKNKYQEYGLHLWSNYSPNEHLNIIGALHWMHNVADVTQKIGITSSRSNTYITNAHGHMNTDWFALGVRFETSLSAGAWTIVPHVEPRYVYAKMRDFDTQIDGATIWRTHAKGNSLFQIPIGIAARADYLTESGWTIRPNADVTITPQAGKTSLSTRLTNIYNAVDYLEGQYMGKFQTAVKIGIQADRKAWTLGAKYGLVAGDRGRLDHGFIVQVRLRF